jgi:hypothetical protein
LLNSVCQLVAHIHVFLVHAVTTLQPLKQQLYFHNKKFDGQIFLVQKRHNADDMCLWVPASESMALARDNQRHQIHLKNPILILSAKSR